MAQGEVVINSTFCMGCGYCVDFCVKKSLAMSDSSYTSQGYLLAEFKEPSLCNACGLCVKMCPHFAIEVYKISQIKEK